MTAGKDRRHRYNASAVMLAWRYIVMAMNATVVFASALALITSVAHAAPAVSITGTGCAFYDGDGGFAFTTNTRILSTQSANGNGLLKCEGAVPPPTSGTAVRYDFATTGGVCVATHPINQATEQWQQTVSANGNVTLVCQFGSGR
ncbi:hypothetical protein JI739_20030 [Ramlibacter sp. AW1]|uniref:Uncharacterized protein n=1 Tax=Ramlibacter aurantiacus TaxID=2801330 RepID=A0A937D836_9BURK|nr:hypothetical protein [Ramlibacter aurantiacus]MBL0422633.1 hypothetical protein [Ramlibacter aurantiacus]